MTFKEKIEAQKKAASEALALMIEQYKEKNATFLSNIVGGTRSDIFNYGMEIVTGIEWGKGYSTTLPRDPQAGGVSSGKKISIHAWTDKIRQVPYGEVTLIELANELDKEIEPLAEDINEDNVRAIIQDILSKTHDAKERIIARKSRFDV